MTKIKYVTKIFTFDFEITEIRLDLCLRTKVMKPKIMPKSNERIGLVLKNFFQIILTFLTYS